MRRGRCTARSSAQSGSAQIGLMARPVMRYFLANVMPAEEARGWIGATTPIVIALTLSIVLAVIPMRAAERRLTRIAESD